MNINFKGQKEVIYNLNNASKSAKQYSTELAEKSCPGASPYIEPRIAKAKMDAYLDSAVADDSFEKTITDLQNQELSILKNNLKKDKKNFTFKYVVFGKEINALNPFLDSLNSALKFHNKKIPNINNIFKTLIEIKK